MLFLRVAVLGRLIYTVDVRAAVLVRVRYCVDVLVSVTDRVTGVGLMALYPLYLAEVVMQVLR